MTDQSGVRLSDLLPKNLDALEQSIEGDLRDGTRGHLSTMAWGFMRSAAAGEVRKALDFDVFELFAQAWAKASELHACAITTPANETKVVYLGKHDFKTAVCPELTIELGVPPHPKLRFTLEVSAHFEGAALSIRNGCITSVETGNASVIAEFKYGKVRLHKEASPMLKLAGRREFKDPGVRIGAACG